MNWRAALRIARWEAFSGTGAVDRRALLIALGGIVVLAALAPAASGGGLAPDTGIYRVGVAESSPYHAPVEAAPQLRAVEPAADRFRAGRIDLLIAGTELRAPDTRKGRAAAAALKAAVERYNDRLMAREPDQAAAFPVVVTVRYVDRDIGLRVDGGDDGSGGSAGTGDPGSADGGTGPAGDPTETPGGGDTDAGGGGGIPSIGVDLFGATAGGTPGDIRPPFPFTSLLLAFVFVVPMNFVIQAYASSVLHERTNRRGELLLITPAGRGAIVLGKTLPYLVAMVGIAGLTVGALRLLGGRAGLLSIVAVIPVAGLFLGAGFLGGVLSRSHKELTFVLTTVSVVVTTFVFVPAIFTDVNPIAAISPLTLVVRDLEGLGVDPGTVVFATVPAVLTAGVFFGLGIGLYREEDLFAQRPLPAKAIDALASHVSGPTSVGVMSGLSMPFVFLAELLALALVFVLPTSIALPGLLAVLATIEEIAKSLHVYAGFERARFDRTLRTGAVVGAVSGAGFFVGEKFALLAQLVGFAELELGRAVLGTSAGVLPGAGPATLAVLLVAPLALHAGTAALTAVGAARGRTGYTLGLVAAIAVHTAYNLGVIALAG